MYRSKREVLSSIKTRKVVKNGIEYTIFSAFMGKNPLTKKPERASRASLDELKEYIADFYKRLEKGGDSAVMLDHGEAVDARAALDLVAQHGIKMSLVDCVRAAIERHSALSAQDCSATVGEAFAKFLESLAPRSPSYRKCMRSRVGTWAARFGSGRKLSEITAAAVKDDLMGRIYRKDDPKSFKTYNNHLGDIKTFMHWCCAKEQSLLAEDPLDGMKKLEIGYRQPEYMKAKDVEKLFRVLEAHRDESPADLADAILSFFCGMRQIEIERVREGEESVRISLEDHFIRVIKCKGSLRGVRPRAFKIPPQAEAWMRSFDFMSAVKRKNAKFREHLNKFAEEAGIALPKNAGRHTFITMFEAAHHDANALSAIVGNTEGVRSRSYNGVEIEREGRAYFEIMPTAESGTPEAQSPSAAQGAR